jgi:hypothetical protein
MQIPHWDPTNISRHGNNLSLPDDLAPQIAGPEFCSLRHVPVVLYDANPPGELAKNIYKNTSTIFTVVFCLYVRLHTRTREPLTEISVGICEFYTLRKTWHSYALKIDAQWRTVCSKKYTPFSAHLQNI